MKLDKISGLTKLEKTKLKGYWITDVEQLLSLVFIQNHSDNLQTLLDIDNQRLSEIIQLLSQSIPENELYEIKERKSPDFPTGSKRPKNIP